MLRHRSRSRGQSLVEFALVAPVLLAIVGVALDFSRVYFTWINLESAARNAAQWVATDPGYTTTGGYYDATDTANYCASYPCTAAPSTDAKAVMDAETGRTFTKSATQTSCTTPTVWASLGTPSTDTGGGSPAYPAAAATVTACMPFTPLFSYPILTQNGTWILRVERTFKVLVGR